MTMWRVTERQSNGVSGNGRNGRNVGGRFGRDGMRFGWDLMAKEWSGIWLMTVIVSQCGRSINQSVYVGVGRCQRRSHTLGLQICQAQSFASRSLRPQFISGPIGIIMSAMLFLEDLINSPTTGPNRLWLSLLFDSKMQQIDCTSWLHVSRPLFWLYICQCLRRIKSESSIAEVTALTAFGHWSIYI